MKFQKSLMLISTLLIMVSVFTSCKDDDKDERIKLTANLSAPNQNGTNPDFVTDPMGTVPSMARGSFEAFLDLETNQLQDIKMTITGMQESDLRLFGPNNTPFHIHLPNSRNEGDFGFNVVDLVFGTEASNITATTNGFEFTRDFVSILEVDQGNFMNAGVHPGDDVITDRLQNGFPFIILHSTKPIFTNTGATLPNGDTAPDGFPFAELRGELR